MHRTATSCELREGCNAAGRSAPRPRQLRSLPAPGRIRHLYVRQRPQAPWRAAPPCRRSQSISWCAGVRRTAMLPVWCIDPPGCRHPGAAAQVFLGDQSVGKTSIITRFMYDKFDNTYQARRVPGRCAAARRSVPGLTRAARRRPSESTSCQRQCTWKTGRSGCSYGALWMQHCAVDAALPVFGVGHPAADSGGGEGRAGAAAGTRQGRSASAA